MNILETIRKWLVLISLLVAVFLGIQLKALVVKVDPLSPLISVVEVAIETAKFVGELFMRSLKLIVVPLIVTSVITGVSTMRRVQSIARLGRKAVGFYALTTLIGIAIALLVSNVLSPGLNDQGLPNLEIKEAFVGRSNSSMDKAIGSIEVVDTGESSSLWFLIRRLFEQAVPTNIIEAASSNGQILGLIIFSILLALVIIVLPDSQSKILSDLFFALNRVMIVITQWIMKIAPVGVFALMLPVAYEFGGSLFLKFWKYYVANVSVLLFQLLVVLPGLVYLLTRVSPLVLFQAMRTALTTAFSTSSSSATLPVTMRCLRENAGASRKVTSFVLPLGSTVNMDGSAICQTIAALLIAQVMGIDITFGTQVSIAISVFIISVGVAGIPSAGLTALVLVLQGANIPGSEAAIMVLIALDRPLDMLATTVNVFSDACATTVVAHSEGEEIFDSPAQYFI